MSGNDDNSDQTVSLMPTLLGSASASIVSRLVTHPLDTVKARLQAVYPPGSPVGSTSASSIGSPTSSTAISNKASPAGSSSLMANHNNNSIARIVYRGPWDVWKRTIQTEGFMALYRGFGAVIYGGTPATVLYLSTYEISKQRLTDMCRASSSSSNTNNNNMSVFIIHFGSGMLAEAVSCIVFVPVDVVKERLQVQHGTRSSEPPPHGTTSGTTSGGNSTRSRSPASTSSSSSSSGMAYKNSWDALSKISQTEGILALYKGYGATLLSFGTFSGLFFLLYERLLLQVRLHLTEQQQQQQQGGGGGQGNEQFYSVDKRQVPFHWTLICSCSAGAVASWLTSPLDMAKLRLQVQRGQLAAATASSSSTTATTSTFQYRNVWHCLQHAYQTAGVRGLFRGAGARVLHFAPSTTVTMTSYETFRTFFASTLACE